MGVLDIEHRVVARLGHRLGEVEIERRIVAAGEHQEAQRIAPDFVNHFPAG